MAINRLYEITRRSFQAFQAGMNTAGQNVANANTEGYHRRRVDMKAEATVSPGLHTSTHGRPTTGNGVSLESYERVRDGLLEAAGRDAEAGLGQAQEETRQLEALEGALAPGGSQALLDDLNAFFEGWNDVANNPTDTNVRSVLLQKARGLTGTLGRLDANVERLQADAQTALEDGVANVNKKLDQIAALNHTVRTARQSGSPDHAAEDQRDQLTKELAAFGSIEVQPKETGYTLTMQGKTVVQGDDATHLSVSPADPAPSDPVTVSVGENGPAFRPTGGDDGKVGAWLRTINETLPGVRGNVDKIAKDLVTDVNSKHQNGTGLDGSTGLDFFQAADPTEPISASNLEVAVSTPEEVAASSAPNEPGNSQQAQAIAGLQDGFTDQAIGLMADVGSQLQSASSRATSRQAALDHVDGMIQGTSGVSVDEEMTKLIEYQQAFSASARVLQTAEEMMDTLLRI